MTAPVSAVDIVDVQLPVVGSAVPVDYADALYQALRMALPVQMDGPLLGVHPLSGLSQGGSAHWYLSRRARLGLRLPREWAEAAIGALAGQKLAVGDHVIELGKGGIRELAYTPVIFSKFITFVSAGTPIQTEEAFVASCQAQFADWGITPQMFCGRVRHAATVQGSISGFSLLLAKLDEDTNLYLQRHGLGAERQRGCGLFVPHKTFSAVTLE